MIMNEKFAFSQQEKDETLSLLSRLRAAIGDTLMPDDEETLRSQLTDAIGNNKISRDAFGLNPVLCSFQTALRVVEEIGLKRDGVVAILLHPLVAGGDLTLDEVTKGYGHSVSIILKGLMRIAELYAKNPVVESENFRNLLLSFAEDMRVILIMIASRVNLMRQIRDMPDNPVKHEVSQ